MTSNMTSAPWARGAAGEIRRLILPAWRRAMLSSGVDTTMDVTGRSALVLAPHPDDETLGCGATIARKRAAGVQVTVVVATDGRFSHPSSEIVDADELAAIRAEEAREACGQLGVPPNDVIQLGYRERSLAESLHEVTERIADIIEARNPEEIYTTCRFDGHEDHQILSLAVTSPAARARRVYEYPVWYWADGPWLDTTGRGLPGKVWHLLSEPRRSLNRMQEVHMVRTGPFIGAKSRALEAYASQTTNLTGEASWAVMEPAFLEQFLGTYEAFFPRGQEPRLGEPFPVG